VYETREYIRSLKGDLSVESQPGVGTKFSIVVPLETSTSEQPDLQKKKQTEVIP
jgi:chemotaxis protein histidine kinase CheA